VRIAIDLRELRRIADFIESNPLVPDIFSADHGPGAIVTRQQIGAEKFRTDCIGFFLLIIFALIVPSDGHRKTESDNEAQ